MGRVDHDVRIGYFAEKPILPEYPLSIGVYVCELGFLPYLSAGNDLAADVVPQLMAKKEKVYGFLIKERHYDIGSFKQLDEAKDILKPEKGRKKEAPVC